MSASPAMPGAARPSCLSAALRHLIAAIAVVMVAASGCGSVANSLSAAERDRYQLSVLTLNLVGAEGQVYTVTVPWRTRYYRAAKWVGDTGNSPDLVFLQETVARKSLGGGGGLNPHDYETLHYLIQQLDFRTGATYRIAYLATGGTALGLNYLNSGQAMLYKADRLRNTTRAGSTPVQPAENTPSTLGFQVRKSYPCTEPAAEFVNSCGLLDGDGLFWTTAFKGPNGSSIEAAAAQFTFVADGAAHFNTYNVHLHPAPETYAATRDLIASYQALTAGSVFPPILAGDFNGGTEAFPEFDTPASYDVDAVTVGKSPPSPVPCSPADSTATATSPAATPSCSAGYAATYRLTVSETIVAPPPSPSIPGYCGTALTMWSDHCGLFVHFYPAR